MTTPNTPAPGSPEWLRAMSDCTARCDRDEDAQGLRAAAERIEELEESLKDSREDAQTYRDDLLRMKASLDRLRAENEALRKEKDRWEQAVRSCVEYSNGREYEWGARAENAFQFLHDAIEAARIDAARKEGAS